MIYANPQSHNLKVSMVFPQRAIDMANDIIREFEVEPLHTLHSYLDVDSYYDDTRALMIWVDDQLQKDGEVTSGALIKTFKQLVPDVWLTDKSLRQRQARHNMKEKDYLEPPKLGFLPGDVPFVCENIRRNIEYPHWLQFNTYLDVYYYNDNRDALQVWVYNRLKENDYSSPEQAVEELTTELWLLIPEVTVR